MKIKKGDNVIVISGKDKGKTGHVLKALPSRDMIIVEGVNFKKVHEKPKKSGQKGQIVDKALPLHVSNVLIIDPKNHKGTRVGKKEVAGKMVRISRRSGAIL